MTYQHKELAAGRWQTLSLIEQLANVGSEVGRALSWSGKNPDYSLQAAARALELLDLTLSDPKNSRRLKEIARAREALVDFFWGKNEYASSQSAWNAYFYPFNWAARIKS